MPYVPSDPATVIGVPLSVDAFAEAFDVSRETCERLATYLDLLRRWQAAINLVGPSTLVDPWRRHVADSAQILPFLPRDTHVLVDLGSGAGLPGLILAILGVPEVHLVESDRRKAQFLREAARATGTSVTVHARRVEQVDDPIRADVVTARALAPLTRLLAMAEPFVGGSTRQIYLKGERAQQELAEARQEWHVSVDIHASRTDPTGAILCLRDVRRA